MTAARVLSEVRRASGLSQRALASRAKITQPALAAIETAEHDTRGSTLERVVAAAGYRLFALPTTAHAAADWAEEIYQELRSARRSEAVAFRALIGLSDDLSSAARDLRVALCVAPPPPCGDTRFDAAVAAVVEYHLERDGLPIPAWVNDATRSLPEPWVATPGLEDGEVPPAFARHGVLLAASELASV
ncbi:MAG: helix-turn-helix transcriptional regulator [Actinomycetota bacterium]|nr:helix-turn-helix transcriptional regulator [Actinomycetota bacterium]MDA8208824.1 helix-turn-helix transcriptional regulator [Actinomycetota bacterium]